MISRRSFFKGSAVVSAAAGFPHLARSADVLHAIAGQKPRHIIHLVADGMSMGTLTLADAFSRLTRKRGLTWMELYKNPAAVQALMNMRSLNSLVTDSSAASSSWGSGSRVLNGVINQLPGKKNLKTLYELFADIGWKRGLVTTTEITHATPAGFAANVDNRDTGTAIAVQYLERKVDVLLGGGKIFFDPAKRKDKRDLKKDYLAAGYVVMETLDQLKAAPNDQRWLGTFASSHLPYTIDHLASRKLIATVPTLAVMTRAALDWLGRENHFILQVEGGLVDHACHNCDAASALHDMIAFDDALEVCLEFQKKNPDTLITVTTDHGNGNMALNGAGTLYCDSSKHFANVAKVKCSFPEIIKHLKKTNVAVDPGADPLNADEGGDVAKLGAANQFTDEPPVGAKPPPKPVEPPKPKEQIPTYKEIMQIIPELTGCKVSQRRSEWLIPFLSNKGHAMYEIMNNEMVQLGQLLANYYGIGWTGNAHTADYVPLIALGPGAELFRGFVENVDVFRHYTSLAGIDFKNPTVPLTAQVGREAGDVENTAAYALA
ncbi:MAG: alkaline phosphatase [Prosthecobacter sp.]|uniref:alkaline phosphatase n=1 Tax=Prosthecobacter sp. TaxID=1965333 RepID=UPI0038FD6F18